ncbi:uncharacterized protein LOC127851407 [Dreissena polymorpha]|uniref:EF-hand domain-containing protein n=1 Tax=Dreissena polymorpha TaxID=45954 RepID=A0A9D4D2K2_DREPO|nr:uncharacterized protein LOC127851407 [Dreissena polymorpha]KAH3736729.1 hypothetical protein DPMN_043302 [Dreissena polymorpha]
MLITRTFLVVLLAVLLVSPADSWRIRVRGRKLQEAVKKVGCKLLYGVACPIAIQAVGSVIEANTGGIAAPVVEPLKEAGADKCAVKADDCKRSVSTSTIMVPFSDEFSDYDTNDDKQISYEEFVFVVIKTVTLADPSQLREPFFIADDNGDGVLDIDEFQGAPFLFAHIMHHQHQKEHIITRETVIGGDEMTDAVGVNIVPAEATTATNSTTVNTQNVIVDDGMLANQTNVAMN